PGDLADLNARHAAVLGQEAIYDFVVATKLKEVLAPNQPLRWGLSSADGYGGGLLPLETYTTLQTLLPLTKVVPDGRLRERLTAIPDRRWLDLLGVEWVVADKVRDLWIEGVYHDLGTPRVLRPGETLRWLVEPSFPADGVSLMVARPLPEGVTVAIRVNEGAWVPLSSEHLHPAVDAWFSARLPLPAAFARTVELHLSPAEADGQLGAPANLALGGLTLTNSHLGSFEALPASPNFRTTLSGDVKVYRRGDALGRAWVVPVAQRAPPGAIAASLADPAFDPRSEVVLAGGVRGDASGMPIDAARTTSGSVTWLRETPEALVLRVTTDGAGWLVLADNWFPGWGATIDGTPVAIERANLFARAVPIPSAGMHVVEFHYRPRSLVIGTTITALALLALLGLTVKVTADRK
ncbi:MAG TPA: hypothetical protein VER55_04570, partial [Ardenticatenaceae bacterium]|nr:hypothetical protein [Ardenticatenaceae bacterium]